MPTKPLRLVLADLNYYLTGRSDVREAAWRQDPWAYPLDWSYQLEREAIYFAPQDEAGVPLKVFAGHGPRYLASRIAGYGLAHWNAFRRTGDTAHRDAFMRIARWFLSRPDGLCRHDFEVAGMPSGWISCISQGEAASVLARAHELTGEADYAQQAELAVAPLLKSVESGGLQSFLPSTRPFLEEYPGTRYKHVLNGCLYAIVGLYDVNRIIPEAKASETRSLFGALINMLGESLEAWDCNGWSTYDYAPTGTGPRNLNTLTYQHLQVVLLRYLAAVTGDARLAETATRWQGSADRLAVRLWALGRKMTYRATAGW